MDCACFEIVVLVTTTTEILLCFIGISNYITTADHCIGISNYVVFFCKCARAKNAEEKEKHLDHCKFLVLKRNVALKKVLPGVKKGIVYDIVFDASGMSVRTECGQLLTVKVLLFIYFRLG